MTWLELLKPGDKVAIFRKGFIYSYYRILTVVRTTKTQIITDDGNRYNKKTGYVIPKEGWEPPYIQEVDDKVRRFNEKFNAIRGLLKSAYAVGDIGEADICSLSIEKLQSAKKKIDEALSILGKG